MSMDIKDYRYILAVTQCGSVSAAAQRLFISQPALSAFVKNLERRAGITFFHKIDGALHITADGQVYLDYARKIVDLDAALSRELDAIKRLDSGKVTVGITATRGILYLPRILPALKQDHPGIEIAINECSSALQLEEQIRGFGADFGFCNYPFTKHDFWFEELIDEEIVVTLPRGDPLCEKAVAQKAGNLKWIDIALLKDKNFILQKKGQRLRTAADEIFSQAGIAPHIGFETSSAITAYSLAQQGVGLTITTSDFCAAFPSDSLDYFSCGTPPKIYKLTLACNSRSMLSNSARAVMAAIKTRVKNMMSSKMTATNII